MKLKFRIRIKRIKFLHESLLSYLLLILYKISLDLNYSMIVSSSYDYAGMLYQPRLYKYLISSLLFIFLLKPIVDLLKAETASATIVLLINLLYFIPGCTFYSGCGIPDAYFAFFSSYWLLLWFWYYLIPVPKVNRLTYASSRFLLYFVFFVLIVSSLVISGIYNNFRLLLSIEGVYELRYAQRAMNLPTFVRYIQPIASTLIPIAIVYCLIHKMKWWSLGLIIAQLFLFAFGGMKNTLFTLVVAIIAYFFFERKKLIWIVLGFVSLNIIALLELLVNNISYVGSIIIYRVYFIPNLLSYQYFDFFKDHELLFWRDSILRRFGFESPYSLPVPMLIGKIYYNNSTNSANNGMCGDAFSNFGWLGLLVFPFLIILVCKIIEMCSLQLDSRISIIVAVIFGIGFTNGSFFVILLSSGLIFACLFLYLLPRGKNPEIETAIR